MSTTEFYVLWTPSHGTSSSEAWMGLDDKDGEGGADRWDLADGSLEGFQELAKRWVGTLCLFNWASHSKHPWCLLHPNFLITSNDCMTSPSFQVLHSPLPFSVIWFLSCQCGAITGIATINMHLTVLLGNYSPVLYTLDQGLWSLFETLATHCRFLSVVSDTRCYTLCSLSE